MSRPAASQYCLKSARTLITKLESGPGFVVFLLSLLGGFAAAPLLGGAWPIQLLAFFWLGVVCLYLLLEATGRALGARPSEALAPALFLTIFCAIFGMAFRQWVLRGG